MRVIRGTLTNFMFCAAHFMCIVDDTQRQYCLSFLFLFLAYNWIGLDWKCACDMIFCGTMNSYKLSKILSFWSFRHNNSISNRISLNKYLDHFQTETIELSKQKIKNCDCKSHVPNRKLLSKCQNVTTLSAIMPCP